MDKYSMIADLPGGTALHVLVVGNNYGAENSQFLGDIGWAFSTYK